MEILDDYQEDSERTREGWIPYLKLENEEVPDVIYLLEKENVRFEIDKMMGNVGTTILESAIIPEFDKVRTLVYINGEDQDVVGSLMDTYYEANKEKHELKEAEIKRQYLAEQKMGKRMLIFVLSSLLFALVTFLFFCYQFYYQ